MSTTDHRPVLIVIAGPNGSGKTTITSKILKHEWLEGAVYINPDNLFVCSLSQLIIRLSILRVLPNE